MVHDLALSVGDQVYLGETWTLTTSLQRCSEDGEIALLGLIRLSMYQFVTIYLVDRPRMLTLIVLLEPVGDTVHMNVHVHTHISVPNYHQHGHRPRGLRT